MIAFYDLDICPVSYDFLHFLTCAQQAAAGHPLHVVIVPGKNAGFKVHDHKPINKAEKQWRVQHILVAACALAGVTATVAPTREFAKLLEKSAAIFPYGYRVDFPRQHYTLGQARQAMEEGFKPRFQASERARQHMRAWLGERFSGRKGSLITITLRETHTEPRNSDFDGWMAAAYELQKRGNRIVVIRDTEKMAHRLVNHGDDQWDSVIGHCPLASCDLDLRMALYEQADLNMASSGGPFMLNVLTGKAYRFFLNVDTAPYSENGKQHWRPTAEYMGKMGLPRGAQWPGATDNQRIVWAPDTVDNILGALGPP